MRTDSDHIRYLIEELKSGLEEDISHPGREDFPHFYEYLLDWEMPPYQREIDLLSSDEILILAPPGHSKTTLLTTFAAWLLGRNNNLRIMVATHTISYSKLLLNQIAGFLQSPQYHAVFGNLIQADNWTATEKTIQRTDSRLKDPSLVAIGAGSSTIGYRCDVIIADDLVTQANSMTPTLRDHLESWFWGSLKKRLEPDGRMLVVGSRFYDRDLYGKLLGSFDQTYVFRTTPENPLWPERYDSKRLEAERDGNYFFFKAQHEQDPIDLGGSFLREIDLQYWLDRPKNLIIYQGVDPCLKDKVGTDHFAHVTVGVDSQRNAYVLDLVYRQAGLTGGAQIVRRQASKWQPVLINLESNAGQALIGEFVLQDGALPINMIESEHPKAVRYTTMGTYFRNKKVLLPGTVTESGQIEVRPDLKPFVEEWRNWPGGYDDALDAMEKALGAAFAINLPAADGMQQRDDTFKPTIFDYQPIRLFH